MSYMVYTMVYTRMVYHSFIWYITHQYDLVYIMVYHIAWYIKWYIL